MSDAIDYISECVTSGRLTREDLMHAFKSRSRMCEIMNRQRGLNLDHIRRFHFDLGLDASRLLIPPNNE